MFHRHKWTMWERKEYLLYGRSGKSYPADLQERHCTTCGRIQTVGV